MQSQLMSPSKTLREIEILKELLHSVREWLRFIDFMPPNGSQTLPLATPVTLATPTLATLGTLATLATPAKVPKPKIPSKVPKLNILS